MLQHHLTDHAAARQAMRHNVDALWPHVEAGAEAVVFTASACASMVSDYGRLLQDDPQYAARAARIGALAKDISQVLAAESAALAAVLDSAPGVRVAFQAPCSLQHALQVRGVVESLLSRAGFTLTAVADGQRCCGSAGTYSILQPELSGQLLRSKVSALEAGEPDVIATANVGCLMHLRSATSLPVCHWVELLAPRLAGG
jgi:glycolate oxidase iron-sulfur subunit